MKTRSIYYLMAISLLAAGRSMAAGQDATVTESVNVVNHGSSQSAASSPAPKGTDIHDGEYLETGSASRAELQFANKTISRLGANTIFNYSASSNQVDLQAGTILFSKPKDGKELNIKTEAVTAAIVGTTGFMQVLHHNGHSTTLFGLIEGHANVNAGGNDPEIGPGEIIVYSPGSAPVIFHFDVPLFLKTSRLITGFPSDLPNQTYIDKEVALFNSLVNRGFITPPQTPYFVYSDLGLPPNFPIIAWSSAKNGLSNFNGSGIPAPPAPPQNECCWCCCGSEDSSFRIHGNVNTDIAINGDSDHHHHGG